MKQVNVRPLGENVLVEEFKAEKKTELGIYLPENASKEAPQEGKVLAIGDSEKIKVKKGQTIIFKKYSGNDVEIGEKKCLIISQEDILAVVE